MYSLSCPAFGFTLMDMLYVLHNMLLAGYVGLCILFFFSFLASIFQWSTQTIFTCGSTSCGQSKRLGVPQPGWVLQLPIHGNMLLDTAFEKLFLGGSVRLTALALIPPLEVHGEDCWHPTKPGTLLTREWPTARAVSLKLPPNKLLLRSRVQ